MLCANLKKSYQPLIKDQIHIKNVFFVYCVKIKSIITPIECFFSPQSENSTCLSLIIFRVKKPCYI